MTAPRWLTEGRRTCGEDSNGFYDRDGVYFRAGVDPRNYYGRLVPVLPWPNRWKWDELTAAGDAVLRDIAGDIEAPPGWPYGGLYIEAEGYPEPRLGPKGSLSL